MIQTVRINTASRLRWIGFVICGSLAATAAAFCDEQAESLQTVKHQVTGLFSTDRVADLEMTVARIPNLQLVSVDFATAEATLKYDPAKAFPNANPMQVIERLDEQLKQASRYTFGAKPLCTIPRDKLQRIEIAILGLDCKACCLAAYESVYKLEGVEQATASFKDGLVTAWIDPQRTDRSKLEEALLQRNVTLKDRATK